MARATRSSARLAAAASTTEPPNSLISAAKPARGITKTAKHDVSEKEDASRPEKRKRAAAKASRPTPSKKIKTEEDGGDAPSPGFHDVPPLTPLKKENIKSESPDSKSKVAKSPADLKSKKLKAYSQYADKSPFPDFPHPTPDECRLAHRILAGLHGKRERPAEVKASSTRAGCGDSPSVLDALVRTILSQNTSDTNSTRAKRSMDAVYGGSDEWERIVDGGVSKLQEAIKCGGLSQVKSKVIIGILNQVREKYGSYSLDHLFNASNEDAMQELISFQGVGPKTASCVLLFCLQRESFAVDTHVWRITGLMGWRPRSASRDETHAHLDVRIPDEDKYGLHILLVKHGKVCAECKAGGKSVGKCELRKAFRQEKIKSEEGKPSKLDE
ncbi:base excision DNA repair protein [Colletotrichum higginsianum]|uniref:Base excision DNA repair protein n=2 Tax=Colletotrichum higginsianum TaxID=80884 RepID=H1UYR8_COLHI|nr:Base excision DNA repair protein [Colletotrichum higginsianum IMI 349063]OBR11461.1 Base excision DNA repair protein [Colletotrichum higginsianum IMI 349063]TIC98779.1 putative DNA glycosylase [Colletotrichum higginsianum]GJC93116.1 base excision DNA repair protein [Colletotrichum higginsianum]CCF33119.1 base excision DNA repair protein [Colletotrichum higginsianum]